MRAMSRPIRPAPEYDRRQRRRLILQPGPEAALAFSDAPGFERGSGLDNTKAGLRLRYAFAREFAPYAGVSRDRKFGETKDILEEEGGDASGMPLFFSVRM